MVFLSLDGLSQRSVGCLLLGASALLTFGFFVVCVTDLSHPPGVRNVRLASALLVAILFATELRFPFMGLALFSFIFPQKLLIRQLFIESNYPLAHFWPDITSWACAAGFTLAISMRQMRTIPPDPLALKKPSDWYQFSYGAWLLLIAITIISAAICFLRLRQAPAEWGLLKADYRGFLSCHPLSELRPLWSALPIVSNGILGLALIRAVLFDLEAAKRVKCVICAFTAGILVVALQINWQIATGFTWSFDEGPPSGPFSNRNLAAPLMVMGVVWLLWFFRCARNRIIQVVCILLALVLCWTVVRTGSRNGIILIVSMVWIFAFTKAGRLGKAVVAVFLPAVGVAALFWMPLPESASIENETLKRSVAAIVKIRKGDWAAATSYRNELWYAAGQIWARYPVFGSGPGTYFLYTNRVPETMSPVLANPAASSFAAHSTPINLLAECGPVVALGWCYIFIFAPLFCIARTRIPAIGSIGLLAFGFANLLDTPWYSDGAMTMGSFWVALAIFEYQNLCELHSSSCNASGKRCKAD